MLWLMQAFGAFGVARLFDGVCWKKVHAIRAVKAEMVSVFALYN